MKIILKKINETVSVASALPNSGLCKILKIQAALRVLIALITLNRSQNEDPYPVLHDAVNDALQILNSAQKISEHLIVDVKKDMHRISGTNYTKDIFNKAWTTFSPEVYEHSVFLVTRRLKASGFDENYFKDKSCFDGGCGTGRLSIAMARMGAKKITAVDIGNESLEYFKDYCLKNNIDNIEIIAHDVTDLKNWNSKSYDFVASNGVLHHTENCVRGIKEHFRITKSGGIFWIYLYGEGGLFWQCFDLLKPMVADIPPSEIRSLLSSFGLREGLIYTFLDNFLAPRLYYSRKKLFEILETVDNFDWQHARGVNEIDDTEILLKTKYGKDIYGPDGEIRLAINRS